MFLDGFKSHPPHKTGKSATMRLSGLFLLNKGKRVLRFEALCRINVADEYHI